MKGTFAERYVKTEDYAALERAAADAIVCLVRYRRGGHFFCLSWGWDWRCDNCKEADRVVAAWRTRP